MTTKLTKHNLNQTLESVVIFSPSLWVREDHLHRSINQHLLDAGFDTIPCDELCEIMEADGYRRFLDAEGRTIWRGIGLQSDRMEERLAIPEDLHPVMARHPINYV